LGRLTNDITAKSGLDAPTNLRVPLSISDGAVFIEASDPEMTNKEEFQ
jgi:hypothetical protein